MAETDGFAVLVTTDSNQRYQQNLQDRSVRIVVLKSASWPKIQRRIARIESMIERSTPGCDAGGGNPITPNPTASFRQSETSHVSVGQS